MLQLRRQVDYAWVGRWASGPCGAGGCCPCYRDDRRHGHPTADLACAAVHGNDRLEGNCPGRDPGGQAATPRDDTPCVACHRLRYVKSGRPEEGRDSVCRLIF